VQVLTIDKTQKKIKSVDVQFGNLKRNFTCAVIDSSDSFVYCGSSTGDVLEVAIEQCIFKRVGPYNKLFG